MKRQFWILFLGAMVAGAGCSKKDQAGAPTEAPTEIVFGHVGSLTGSEATFGQSTDEGVKLAVDQVNQQGGVNGLKIRVITLDDQGKPEEAATAVTKLISQDKVNAIIGEVASSKSLAMAPIAQANKVPMVTPSSTNPKVTLVGDYIFRVCFIDPFQGSVMAQFAKNSLKAKKAAILRDIKNDYSMGLADFFAETFTKMGGEIVLDQSYSQGDVDFKSQLTAIKTKNPDVIFVPGYYTEVGLVARQTKEMGIKAPLLGGDGWDSTKLTEIGGAAMNGNFFSNHYSQDDESPRVQKFVKDYQAKYSKKPDGLAALGYDAVMVIVDAMKRSNSTSNEMVKNELAKTKDYPGVTGNISMNETRDAVKSAVILEIKDGGFKYRETIEPRI